MIRTTVSLFLVFVLASFGQKSSEASFAGTWEARLKDRVFLVLKIVYDGKVSGSMSRVSISADEEGNVTDAEPAGEESPVHDLKVDGDRLTFVDDEPAKFEMKLTSEGAEFRILDEGVKLKPIQLHRR